LLTVILAASGKTRRVAKLGLFSYSNPQTQTWGLFVDFQNCAAETESIGIDN